MELVKGNIKVEWARLGEGFYGDYDPSDPEDEELLRFDVSRKENGEWEEVPDASYCTVFPANSSMKLRKQGLKHIMAEIYEPASDGHSIKKICERLSHLCPEDVSQGN